MSDASNASDVADLVGQMTLQEKCTMVRGETPWTIPGCARLGIPDWCVSDGPVGVRGRAMGPGLLMPGPSAIAATWNASLVEEIGSALGEECVDRRVDMLLAPTVNLHRSPRGGRHFESYSEDPELSSRIAVAFISGVQSRGVGACVKHFVANDQEFERHTIDVRVDERSLREIYLPPFEAAVKEAGVRAVMAAYNFVNGHHACAQPDLLVRLLKEEWGFEGFVVSDWGAIKETVAPARHGLDLEMAGPGRHWGNGQIQAAVEAGEVDESMVDDKVRRIIGFLDFAGRLGTETDHNEKSIEHPEHRALARQAATESIVLIRNTASALPIAATQTVALIGPGVAQTTLTGGGSASLIPHRESSVLDSMTGRLGDRLVGTAGGIDMRRKAPAIPAEWLGPDGVTCELFDGAGFDGEPFETVARPGTFNVWFGDSFPADRDAISVRMSFDMTPVETGRHRVCALGFGHATVAVEDQPVADNSIGRFSGGLGLFGGVGYVDLEAGRTYRVRVEHLPRDTAEVFSMVDMGIELAASTREDDLLEAERLAQEADVAVVVVGSNAEWEAEGTDRESIELPNGQDELVQRVLAVNPNTVVVLNCGAPMTLPWLDDVAAAMLAWYPGQEGGHAIADVLLGDAEPGGRMPTTWARDERDTPSFLHYPGEAGAVRYEEGVFVGYRGYDTSDVEPMIPFGHGGSYTTFEWGSPVVAGRGTDRVVELPITNTGDRRGSEVVQVYIAPHVHVVPRPTKELAGFAKVSIEPGATETARVALKGRSFARWDTATGRWVVDAGTYSIVVAASAIDVRSAIEVTVS